MWRVRNLLRPQADVPALEAKIQRAGMALACAYSTSDEYEAAIIAERREAGAYGTRRPYRHLVIAAVALAVAVMLLFVLAS